MKHEADRFTCLIRVRTTDVASWLLADYPLAISVTGAAHEQYRVVWDRTLQYISQARERLSALPGYSGLAFGKNWDPRS
eukprot:6394039-Amphidinium_carterae.2